VSPAAPAGFRAGAGPLPGVAVLINDGPSRAAAGVLAAGDAPALWSGQVLHGGQVRAVALMPARTGAAAPDAFADVHQTAEYLARVLTKLGPRETGAGEIAVCWAAGTQPRPPLGELFGALAAAATAAAAAPVLVSGAGAGYAVGGTVLGSTVLLTTDADLGAGELGSVLSPDPGDSVLLLASGAAGVRPGLAEFAGVLGGARAALAGAAA
jgi:glutamate N-acetyltransferase/amino-acid N-acetyltransferase